MKNESDSERVQRDRTMNVLGMLHDFCRKRTGDGEGFARFIQAARLDADVRHTVWHKLYGDFVFQMKNTTAAEVFYARFYEDGFPKKSACTEMMRRQQLCSRLSGLAVQRIDEVIEEPAEMIAGASAIKVDIAYGNWRACVTITYSLTSNVVIIDCVN
ncbi:MAG: hypothetical protein PHT88_02405 [Candidatus Moranbacteria bacterium]|nr:hypothetical protein [Candidatus Moranbacteria bacterium]